MGGRYKVLRLLGEGGMGSVYEAENTWTHRRVALKVLLPAYATNEEAAQRFMREARSAAQLAHPHIVDVLDMGREEPDGALYIVQELLDGTDLRHRLVEAGRLSPREAVATLAPVMEALAFAHARGVVHRDLKPENIFLAKTPAGVVPTLIDFGISKVAPRPEEQFRTRTGLILGTPWYMAPEQALGEAIDGRVDVWSVGVVLYELLAGTLPFDVSSPNAALVFVVTRPVPRIEQHAPDIPRALAETVHRALERDPARRFPDMRSFLDALRACPLPDAALAGASSVSGHTPTVAAAPQSPERTPTPVLVPVEAAADPLGPTEPPPPMSPPREPAAPPAASQVPVAAPPRPSRGRQTLGLVFVAMAAVATCLVSGLLFTFTHRGVAPTPTALVAPDAGEPVAPTPSPEPVFVVDPNGWIRAPEPSQPGWQTVRVVRGGRGRGHLRDRNRDRERDDEREDEHERRGWE